MELISWVSPIAATGALWLGIANKRRLDRQDALEAVKFEIELVKGTDFRLIHTGSEKIWNVTIDPPRVSGGIAIDGFYSGTTLAPGEVSKFTLFKSKDYMAWPETLTIRWQSEDGYFVRGKASSRIVRLPQPVAIAAGDAAT